ncbi:MAG: DUF4197 domain-containing protein [Candidatus Krumholzibacteriota bacterium]|nr:DUF4197 domain-containing protein [Candidatus Krumholzibacteriota bacterium]
MRRICLSVPAILAISILGCASLQEDLGSILDKEGEGPLDETTVIAGIKEALRVGTENTVLFTSRPDGYLGNKLIHIVIPDQLESAAEILRQIGLGGEVDKLEVGMNRAAELAAAEAREVFWSAITGMTVSDAFGILNGGDTSATEYFHDRTYTVLHTRFHPIVRRKIDEIHLSRVYGRIAGAYNTLPRTGTSPLVDLDEYVTEKALAGLFTVLAQEERKIRQDPLARTTDLLRRVFGS